MSIGYFLGLVLALVAVAGTPTYAHAQFGKRLKDALKRNAEDKAIQKATGGDNVGQAEANQTLSEKRAAAVRQFLIDSYGIDGARLQAKGLGQTKPVASNDTPEGRQSNRRVELVKM